MGRGGSEIRAKGLGAWGKGFEEALEASDGVPLALVQGFHLPVLEVASAAWQLPTFIGVTQSKTKIWEFTNIRDPKIDPVVCSRIPYHKDPNKVPATTPTPQQRGY